MNDKDFNQYLAVKKGLAKNSIKMYTIRFQVFERWLHHEHKEFNKESVELFIYELREKKLKNSAINTYILMFGHLKDYLSDRGVSSDFLQGFRSLPKVESSIEVLTVQEIERLLAVKITYKQFRGQDTSHLDIVYNTFWRLLADTGTRFDEAAGLQVKHVNFTESYITVTETAERSIKTKNNRKVFPSSFTMRRISELVQGKKPDDLIFTNFLGNKLIPQTSEADLTKRKTEAGIKKKVHPHLFRHSFATELIRSGVGVETVRILLGHKDISSTIKYIHLADDSLRSKAYRHPRLKNEISARDKLMGIKEKFDEMKLDLDERFDCIIEQGKKYLILKVQIDE